MQDGRDLGSILAELATVHLTAAALAKEAYTLVVSHHASVRHIPIGQTDGVTVHGELIVSHTECCVEWRGRRCMLGPSLPFKLMHRLSRHPDRYFTYELLMDEVWQSRCSEEAVRAMVKRLRRALRHADMADLALSIQVRGRRVGLFLNGLTS